LNFEVFGKIQLLITDGLKPVIEDINGVRKDVNGVKREVDGLKDEISDIKDSIRLIPNKEEFFDSMDKLMGEIKKNREEQEIIGDTLSQHTDRLEKVEAKVGISPSY